MPICPWSLPPLADLPLFFISAYGRGETVVRAPVAGAAHYIVKPLAPAELVAPLSGSPNRYATPGPFALGDLAIDRAILRVLEQGQHAVDCWGARRLVARQQEPFPGCCP